MDWIDWIIIALLLSATLFGFFKGFVHEVLSLIGWIAALIAAKIFSARMYEILGNWLENDTARWILAWFIPLIVVLLIFASLKFILKNLIETTGLGGINHILGGVFGFAKVVLIMTIIVLGLRLTLFNDAQPIRKSSIILPYFDRLSVMLADPVADYVQPKINQLRQQVKQLDDSGEAPDPIELLNSLGWDDTAMSYIRKHPHQLDKILEELKDNPNWKDRWEKQIEEWRQKND